MANTDGRDDVRLTTDVHATERPAARELGDDRSFVIVVLGDFSGAGGAAPGTAARRLLDIDRDNFDDILQRFHIQCAGTLAGLPEHPAAQAQFALALRALDDFHPDRIVEQAEPLRVLLDTRRALDDPARFDAVAAAVMKWAAPDTPVAPAALRATEPSRAAAPTDAAPADLLNLILDQSTRSAPQPTEQAALADLQGFVEEIVAPHLVRIDSARQAALVGAVDRALAQQVLCVLHHPAFQALEATWRSLRWLVNAAETGPRLKIRVAQFTRDELRHDTAAGLPVEDSQLGRLFLERRSDPPALLIGNYEFAQAREDIAALQHIGRIARLLRAPFVAAAGPALIGRSSFTEMPSPGELTQHFEDPACADWQALRRAPEACWLALALPRLLCRLPYGASTEPAETFALEEPIRRGTQHHLLWGNPAFAVAAVAAAAFSADGWSLDLSQQVHQLDGLPLHVYDDEGTSVTTPCAEVLLSDRVVAALEQAGLIPLVSARDSDCVALPCVQSLAEPRAALAWD